MKTLFYSTLLFTIFSLNAIAQVQNAEVPYIEITGTAEMEVVPDMIYLKIILSEKNAGTKSKVSIKEQEDSLKLALKKVNIDLTKLSLSDASSQYIRVSWGKDNVITKKEYTLLLSDAESLGKVLRELDRLKVSNAFISKVDHSEILGISPRWQAVCIKVQSVSRRQGARGHARSSASDSSPHDYFAAYRRRTPNLNDHFNP